MKNTSRSRWHSMLSVFPGRSLVRGGLVLSLLAVLSTSLAFASAGTGSSLSSSGFDMSGTITEVLDASTILVGKEKINLEGIDPSDLNSASYSYLMMDLSDWLIGKDVFVKGSRVYFDLNGAYNSVIINEMIQKEVDDLWDEQYYHTCYFRKGIER
jgi:hypothetical protein